MKIYRNVLHRHIVVIAVVLLSAFSVMARDLSPVINGIIESYVPWTSAEFNGKLRTEKLPFSPTVKMYMVRDSLLQISVRAPLLGEVGRLNLTREQLIIVNKMRKVYCEERTENLQELYPSLLADVQSLFLGRVTILGYGELDVENVGDVSVDKDNEGNLLLVPQTGTGVVPFNYGYLVGSNSRTRALVATIPGKGSVEILYDYRDRGEQMDVTLDRGDGRLFGAELDFSSVKWGGTEMPPVRLSSYQKVGFKEFVNSVK